MPNPPNRPSRSASIPIPGASGRSIEDILNFNSLTPTTPAGTSTSPSRTRSQQPSTAAAATVREALGRSLYSGLEATRPASTRHASASTSLGSARHALGGGSGPPWGARSVSAAVPAGAMARSMTAGFEPRVIRGTSEHNGAGNGASEPRPILAQRRSSQSSPSRRTGRMSTGGRAPVQSLRPAPSSPVASTHQVAGPGHGPPAASTPVPFAVPSYIQHSALRDMIQTEPAPVATPAPTPSVDRTRNASVLTQRDVTPITESEDDDSEASVGRGVRGALAPVRDRGRARERQNAYAANVDPVLRLPTRWNEQDRNKFLYLSEDGRSCRAGT